MNDPMGVCDKCGLPSSTFWGKPSNVIGRACADHVRAIEQRVRRKLQKGSTKKAAKPKKPKRVRYCVVDTVTRQYMAKGRGEIAWTYNLDEAKQTIADWGMENAAIFDADAFAKLPDPSKHTPIWTPIEGSQ